MKNIGENNNIGISEIINKMINKNNKSCCTCLHGEFIYTKHYCPVYVEDKDKQRQHKYHKKTGGRFLDKVCTDCKHTIETVNKVTMISPQQKHDHWNHNELSYWHDYINKKRDSRFQDLLKKMLEDTK